MTAHIESKEGEIAKKVLMPGDPLRAKYIAENFLTDYKIVNNVRNMLGYTGYYNNQLITVFASGMGSPSIGIYAYELYKFYGVETIIRIGTCGTPNKEVKLKDLVIPTSSYTLTSYPKLFFDDDNKEYSASSSIVKALEIYTKNKNYPYHKGVIITSDIFDVYVDKERYYKLYPSNINYLACEMEAATLFCLAKHLNKKAGCILTVVDSDYDKNSISSEEREKNLNDMITISLDTLTALD